MDLVGKRIRKVTYYEVNRRSHPMFFKTFDNFDLGINIEFSDGTNWSIGWKDHNYPEAEAEKYLPREHYDSFLERNATHQWNKVIGSAIVSAEIQWVAEHRRILGRCNFRFKNRESVAIIMGSEPNLDGSLPLPLRYQEGSDFYVFHTKETPPYEAVKLVYPTFDERRQIEDEYEDNEIDSMNRGTIRAFDDAPTKKIRGEVVFGFLLFLGLLTVCLYRLYS